MSEHVAKRRMTAADLWSLPRVGLPVPAPNGACVVVGVRTYRDGCEGGTDQLHLIPTATPDLVRALTPSDVSCAEPAISPDAERLAFIGTPNGSDRGQLYVMPLAGGDSRQLTDFPLGASDPRWHPDGRHVIVLSQVYRGALTMETTRRRYEERSRLGPLPHVTEDRVFRHLNRWLTDGQVHHLFLVDTATGTATDLIPSSERWFDLMDPSGEYDVAPGGDEIAFAADSSLPPHDVLRWAIYVASIRGGELRCMTGHGTSDDKRPRFSANGRWLVYGSRPDPTNFADRVRLVRFDRATGEQVMLAGSWDVSPTAWEFAGDDSLIIDAELHGRSCLFRLRVDDFDEPKLIARGGTFNGVRPAADGQVYVQHHTFVHPPEVARCSALGGPIEVLSHFTDAPLADIQLGRVEELDFTGAGSEPVHMFLLFPPEYDDTRPAPLLHHIHGGPYAMHADGWNWRWNAQALAAPGYVLAMVNFHGSRSYGDRFAQSVLGDWGGRPAEDLLHATDLLIDRGIADPARMAIAGGSYGGYLATWLVTRSDRFACAIAHATRYNLTTTSATDITYGCKVDYGGEPWDLPQSREALDLWNPAAYVSNVKTPMLVLHGDKDFRCTVQNALELYGSLKARKVPARLVVYPDEGHAILKQRNLLHWYGEVHAWLERFLSAERDAQLPPSNATTAARRG